MKPLTAVFVVDGMRPDAMLQANTPTIDRLIASGASTMEATTVMPSVTLPSHTSMFRGVDVPRHGITTNTFMPLARPVPSLFDAAGRAGLRVGMFYNWGELRDLCDPWSLAASYYWADHFTQDGDGVVARSAAKHVQDDTVDLFFVYLGHTDASGHDEGWMSEKYMSAIENADKCIGTVIASMEESGRPYTVLVLADHGGHEQHHGTDMPVDMTIPWILSGYGVKPGKLNGDIRIFDTCPTIAKLIGVPLAREWEGRVIDEALVRED